MAAPIPVDNTEPPTQTDSVLEEEEPRSLSPDFDEPMAVPPPEAEPEDAIMGAEIPALPTIDA